MFGALIVVENAGLEFARGLIVDDVLFRFTKLYKAKMIKSYSVTSSSANLVGGIDSAVIHEDEEWTATKLSDISNIDYFELEVSPYVLATLKAWIFRSNIKDISTSTLNKVMKLKPDMKDFFLSRDNAYKRLEKEFVKYGRIIMAVDFDDTIYDFHNLGRSYDCVIDVLKRWKPYAEIIINTGNGHDKDEMIYARCKEIGLEIDGINCPASIDFGGRKTYANVYVDDRGGLAEVYGILLELIEKIEGGTVIHDNN